MCYQQIAFAQHVSVCVRVCERERVSVLFPGFSHVADSSSCSVEEAGVVGSWWEVEGWEVEEQSFSVTPLEAAGPRTVVLPAGGESTTL